VLLGGGGLDRGRCAGGDIVSITVAASLSLERPIISALLAVHVVSGETVGLFR
jgi:hypothetical protein